MKPLSNEALLGLRVLRTFPGPPVEFWADFLDWFRQYGPGVEKTWVLLEAEEAERWKLLAFAPPELSAKDLPREAMARLTQALRTQAVEHVRVDGKIWYGAQLELAEPGQRAVLILETSQATADWEGNLRIAADVTQSYTSFHREQKANWAHSPGEAVLEITRPVLEETKFQPAAMTAVQELAKHLEAEMVYFGWEEKGYLKLRAASRHEKIERKMEAARQIEAAMDEALDQDDELTWPQDPTQTQVTRDHERLAQTLDGARLASVPIRVDGHPCGVLLAQRGRQGFGQRDLTILRLVADQIGPFLRDRRCADRPLPFRLAGEIARTAKAALGWERLGLKLTALIASAILLAFFLIQVPYRVEATFIVRAAEQAHVPAPYDGFLRAAYASTGDAVEPGAVLLELDPAAWELEAAGARADIARFRAEAQRAESDGDSASWQVSRAQAAQAEVSLSLAQRRLASATIRAPISGVVIENADLAERRGAAVERGEVLLRLAKLESLFLELEIDERDISEVVIRGEGVASFATAVGEEFPVELRALLPAAVPTGESNVFLAEADLTVAPEPWWRPGMTGLVKLEAGQRSLFYIVSHRALDWLRMFFWI